MKTLNINYNPPPPPPVLLPESRMLSPPPLPTPHTPYAYVYIQQAIRRHITFFQTKY